VSMLHVSQPGSQARVNPETAAMLALLGIPLATQRDYLQEYLHLHPETKVTVRKNKLNQHKAIQLTNRKIRQDPELQNKRALNIHRHIRHDMATTNEFAISSGYQNRHRKPCEGGLYRPK